ncbi:MAG: hypothetical protein KC621_25010 [Myxococcales bacterium]|nr:hypothetical protein [Myxococcales bacterium]
MVRASRWWSVALWWAGCVAPAEVVHDPDPSTPTTSTPVETPPVSVLTPDELLTRVSLDLRGIRPSIEELAAFDDAPGEYEAVVEAYLHDPHLQRRAVDFYSEIVPSRIAGEFYVDLDTAYGDRIDAELLKQHVAEEPLRMFAWVVEHDQPYGAMVEGNWTVVDDLLAKIFPVDYPADGTGWQRATYTDGRPGAGALSSNGLWWFRGSAVMNRQRARGNLVSRVLLCDDYLERVLPFSQQAFGSDDAMDDAVNHDPACQACHATLDPLSAHFWGFYYDAVGRQSTVAVYHAEQERMWEGAAPPGFMGQPSDGLGSLGAMLQDDPRFASCFVEEAFAILSRRDAKDLDIDLSDLVQTYEDTGGNVREVLRAVVMRPEYRGYDPRLARRRMAPQVFDSMVEDLTGFTWTTGDVDQMTAFPGYGVMVGSSDGAQLGQTTATVSTILVQKRFAEAAAAYVVRSEGASGAERRLFSPGFDLAAQDDALVEAELSHLYLRMLGRELDEGDPELVALSELFTSALDVTDDTNEAWIAVVTALLRHPDMENY